MIIFELVNKGIGNYGLGGIPLVESDLLQIEDDAGGGGSTVTASTGLEKVDNDIRLGVPNSFGTGRKVDFTDFGTGGLFSIEADRTNTLSSRNYSYFGMFNSKSESLNPENEFILNIQSNYSGFTESSGAGIIGETTPISGYSDYSVRTSQATANLRMNSSTTSGVDNSYLQLYVNNYQSDDKYQRLILDTTGNATFEDDFFNRGLVYAGDYESNFIARSLITKQYLEGAGTANLAGRGLSTSLGKLHVGDPYSGSINESYIRLEDYFLTGSATFGVLHDSDISGQYNYYALKSTVTNDKDTFLAEAVVGDFNGFTIQAETSLTTGSKIQLRVNEPTAGNVSEFIINTAGTSIFTFVDGSYSKGAVYGGDYELNFTARSLITKQFLEAQLTGLGTVTEITAGAGLTGGVITTTGTISHADTSTLADITNTDGTIIQSLGFDTYGHVISGASLNGDLRWLRGVEVLSTSSTWSHVVLTSGIDLTPYTTGSTGFPSTLGYAVAFYANTSDSTSGFGRAFALNRAYNTENYYLGSPNTSGVHNGWRLIYHSGNLNLTTLGGEPAFTKGNLIQGTGVTLTGTLTGRLVGAGDITISASGGGGITEESLTFTPTLTDSGGGATYTTSGNTGQIYRVGKFVQIWISMNVTSTTGTPTGEMRFGGITGSFTIAGNPNGTLRIFSGSNQTDAEVALLYPNNVDGAPLTIVTLRRKTTGTGATGMSITSGTIELIYSFTIA